MDLDYDGCGSFGPFYTCGVSLQKERHIQFGKGIGGKYFSIGGFYGFKDKEC